MRHINIPWVKASSLFSVESTSSAALFNPLDIAGSATKATHKPRYLGMLNGVSNPVVTQLQRASSPTSMPGRFIDIRAFLERDELAHKQQQTFLLNQAVEKGFLIPTTVYRADFSDEGIDKSLRLVSTHLSLKDALSEVFDDNSRVAKEETFIGTDKLIQQMGITRAMAIANGPLHGTIAMFEQMAENGMKIDGIFWSDKGLNEKAAVSFCSLFKHSERQWEREVVPMPMFDTPYEKNVSDTYWHRHDLAPRLLREASIPSISL